MKDTEAINFKVAARYAKKQTAYTDDNLRAYKKGYVMRFETIDGFNKMKFYLAKANADPPHLNTDELAGYRWVRLPQANKLWNFNKFHQIMSLAEGNITAINSVKGMKKT